MQRIKHIDQSGPARFFGPKLPKFTRFDHCIGVWALLKKAGASKREQIAGLLHDTSHTVFSHVSDHLFTDKKDINKYTDVSYQDTVHMSYIKGANLKTKLEKAQLTEADLNPEMKEYTALEQSLPDMCADRIQYNIHTGIILGLISKKEAKEIINDLSYEGEKWFFSTPEIAVKFGRLSLYFTKKFWGAKWNTSMNMHLARALKVAMQIGLIQHNDLYTTDDKVMSKLKNSDNKSVQLYLQQCEHPTEKMPNRVYEQVRFSAKFRGIDPLVKIGSSLKRLTEIDSAFSEEYKATQAWAQKGYVINMLIA
jgi:HD superfamily phosphohydrolase